MPHDALNDIELLIRSRVGCGSGGAGELNGGHLDLIDAEIGR